MRNHATRVEHVLGVRRHFRSSRVLKADRNPYKAQAPEQASTSPKDDCRSHGADAPASLINDSVGRLHVDGRLSGGMDRLSRPASGTCGSAIPK